VPRTRYSSLLDDPVFLAELEAIDVPGPPALDPPEWEWFAPAPPPPSHHASPAAAVARQALGLAGLLMMMGIGGAAAAYVFADRLAVILSR
jgi:hypothetical protein